MAMVNPRIKAEMVDAQEFMDLTRKFRVQGVPKTVINDGAVQFEGAVPEAQFLRHVLAAATKTA